GAGGGLATYSGTSMATPQVAGAAALAQQLSQQVNGRRLTQSEFAELLRITGVPIFDGDDEDDNVVNTIAEYRRIDMLALANAIESGGLAEISVPAGIALDPTGIAVAGGQLRVDVTLANQGPAATGPFVSRFYLSTDGIWDAGDAPLLTIDDDIGPGQTSPRRGLAVPLPDGLAPGEYFFLLKLDADQQVAEGNEGNNLAVVPITIEAAAPEVWVGMAETGAPIVSGVTLIEFG
ncbi:MAG TPA: CARDB domain-containing protein, partial [Lacipirellulaceae bacterium]|nr:CARDB domain-containing protein [Lacipirellulaceae bacterium]